MRRLLCSAGLVLLLIAVGCAGEKNGVDEAAADSAAAPAVDSAPAAPAATPAPEAAQLVRELYAEHDAQRGPFFQTESRARLDRFFEPALAELIWKDAVDANGEVGALGFDPLYDAQDVEPKNLTVHPPQNGAAGAVEVPVSFESHGEKRQLTYVLTSTAGSWKISDIRYADGRTLRGVYQPAAA